MRSCLILGAGRSGTSMLAGVLHQAGYFMGDRLHRPRQSNPKGFFEWYRVNRVNEAILAAYDRSGLFSRLAARGGRRTVKRPGKDQRWLALLPPRVTVACHDPALQEEMAAIAGRRPFAYKDPRFCYTLPAWRPRLPEDTVFVCIFRDPAVTVASILAECRSQPYLADLRINRRLALRVWQRMHESLLEQRDRDPAPFRFVHYDQVLDGSALPRLAEALQAPLQAGFADPALRRSRPDGAAPARIRRLYGRLCELAGHPSPT